MGSPVGAIGMQGVPMQVNMQSGMMPQVYTPYLFPLSPLWLCHQHVPCYLLNALFHSERLLFWKQVMGFETNESSDCRDGNIKKSAKSSDNS